MFEFPPSGSLALPKSKPSSPSPKVLCLEGIGGIFRSLEIDGVRSGGCGFSGSFGGLDIVLWVCHLECIFGLDIEWLRRRGWKRYSREREGGGVWGEDVYVPSNHLTSLKNNMIIIRATAQNAHNISLSKILGKYFFRL